VVDRATGGSRWQEAGGRASEKAFALPATGRSNPKRRNMPACRRTRHDPWAAKGDDELRDLGGRKALALSAAREGGYAEHHPSTAPRRFATLKHSSRRWTVFSSGPRLVLEHLPRIPRVSARNTAHRERRWRGACVLFRLSRDPSATRRCPVGPGTLELLSARRQATSHGLSAAQRKGKAGTKSTPRSAEHHAGRRN